MQDFGVDKEEEEGEEVEYMDGRDEDEEYMDGGDEDEDDVPLSEILLRRRRGNKEV